MNSILAFKIFGAIAVLGTSATIVAIYTHPYKYRNPNDIVLHMISENISDHLEETPLNDNSHDFKCKTTVKSKVEVFDCKVYEWKDTQNSKTNYEFSDIEYYSTGIPTKESLKIGQKIFEVVFDKQYNPEKTEKIEIINSESKYNNKKYAILTPWITEETKPIEAQDFIGQAISSVSTFAYDVSGESSEYTCEFENTTKTTNKCTIVEFSSNMNSWTDITEGKHYRISLSSTNISTDKLKEKTLTLKKQDNSAKTALFNNLKAAIWGGLKLFVL